MIDTPPQVLPGQPSAEKPLRAGLRDGWWLALATTALAAATVIAVPGLLDGAYPLVRVLVVTALLAAFTLLALACTRRPRTALVTAGLVTLATALAAALLVPPASLYPAGTVRVHVDEDTCQNHQVCDDFDYSICGSITGTQDSFMVVEALIFVSHGRYEPRTTTVLLPLDAVATVAAVDKCSG